MCDIKPTAAVSELWVVNGISVGRESHLKFKLIYALSQIIRCSLECRDRRASTNEIESDREISTHALWGSRKV